MVQQLFPELVASASEIGRAFAPVVASLCGGGVVWKLVDKLIDVSEARRKSREDHEGETNKELRERVTSLNDKLVESIRDSAQVPFLKSALDECKKQLDEADTKIDGLEEQLALSDVRHQRQMARKDGDMQQLIQNNKILMEFFGLMDDQEGQEYLRRKRAQRNQP